MSNLHYEECGCTACIYARNETIERLKAQLAKAELVRDSWRREAEINDESTERAHVMFNLLKQRGIHIEEPWCWCNPDQITENHWVHND